MTGILLNTVKPHMLQSLMTLVSFITMSSFVSLSLASLTDRGVAGISPGRSAVIAHLC